MIKKEDLVKRVEEHQRLFNKGQVTEALARMADDATIIGSSGTLYKGKADIQAAQVEVRERSPDRVVAFELVEFRQLGDTFASAIWHWRLHGGFWEDGGYILTVYEEREGEACLVQSAVLKTVSQTVA